MLDPQWWRDYEARQTVELLARQDRLDRAAHRWRLIELLLVGAAGMVVGLVVLALA